MEGWGDVHSGMGRSTQWDGEMYKVRWRDVQWSDREMYTMGWGDVLSGMGRLHNSGMGRCTQ